MEELILLLFGENIPPHRHLHKLSNKFIIIFLKEREKETFKETDYYLIFVEERNFGEKQREYINSPAIPVHKNFLYQVEFLYANLNAEMILCTKQHEHPIVFLNQIEFEGFCYYVKNSNEKILFFESDIEQLSKSFIRMPKEVSAEQVMKNWLTKNI